MNFKKIVLLLVSFCFISVAVAQDKPAEPPKYGWHKEMLGGLNVTQTSFDNWKQGGENSLAWQANLNFNFTNDQEKTNWANSGKFVYGHTKIGDQESRKSVDEIKLESVFTYKLGTIINPFVATTGETQFTTGYDYGVKPKSEISAFFDPAYFRESAGIGYKPNEIVKTRLGVAMKQTITDKYSLRFTGKADETLRNEVGAESVTDVNWKVTGTSVLTSKLELFSTLKSLDETDVKWDNLFSTKISKYFNVNFNFNLFYDKDISQKRQIKQAIALGFTYIFL